MISSNTIKFIGVVVIVMILAINQKYLTRLYKTINNIPKVFMLVVTLLGLFGIGIYNPFRPTQIDLNDVLDDQGSWVDHQKVKKKPSVSYYDLFNNDWFNSHNAMTMAKQPFTNKNNTDNDPWFESQTVKKRNDFTNGINETKKHKRHVTESTKKLVAAHQRWKCAICGCLLDETYEVDHISPLYKGGTNELNNLMALDPICHRKKTNADRRGLPIEDYFTQNNTQFCDRTKYFNS
jgi:5-methylcytosine-specific restriction endonuclease McrA